MVYNCLVFSAFMVGADGSGKLQEFLVIFTKTLTENWYSKRHLPELSWPIYRLRPKLYIIQE